MSIDKLEEQKEELLDQIEALEDKCDTLPICEEDDGCERCETYAKIEELSAKVEELEDKIEELMGEDDD
jgi:outer membrane murein-binding lipoprotein Lpp